jgi:predicted RNA-binding protein with PUA-like domain
MNYWLMKSEPEVYGIETLAQEGETLWDGVRNYQARNYLKQMQVGDVAFFYHSNTKPPGIVGLMTVLESQVVDSSQFDPTSDYFDPKSPPDQPRWHTVRVGFKARWPSMLTLEVLREKFTEAELGVVQKGTRLSVLPVDEAIAQRLLTLAEAASGT